MIELLLETMSINSIIQEKLYSTIQHITNVQDELTLIVILFFHSHALTNNVSSTLTSNLFIAIDHMKHTRATY
jgi:hypothetical protein